MTDMSPTLTMSGLYARLRDVGVDRAFVRKAILPPWWDDEIASTADGYTAAAMLVARNLCVDPISVLQDSGPIHPRQVGHVCFKTRGRVDEADLLWAKTVAWRAAELACQSLGAPACVVPQTPLTIRDHILGSGNSYVTLPVLLEYCWGMGIPVLHVSMFPSKTAKMDAIAAAPGGRPAVVLASNRRQSAWVLFQLAHELGHIALRHLDGGRVLVDERISTGDADPEEHLANQFALELIAGDPDIQTAANYWLSAKDLAVGARRWGVQFSVDPGVIVLNYARTCQRPEYHRPDYNAWAVAESALKILDPYSDARSLIRATMRTHIDWGRLTLQNAEFLQRITGAMTVDTEPAQ